MLLSPCLLTSCPTRPYDPTHCGRGGDGVACRGGGARRRGVSRWRRAAVCVCRGVRSGACAARRRRGGRSVLLCCRFTDVLVAERVGVSALRPRLVPAFCCVGGGIGARRWVVMLVSGARERRVPRRCFGGARWVRRWWCTYFLLVCEAALALPSAVCCAYASVAVSLNVMSYPSL